LANTIIYTYIHIHSDQYISIIFTSLEKDLIEKMLINSLLATASTITSQKLPRTALSSSCPTTTMGFSEVGCYPGWRCGQQIHGFAHPASNINIL